MAVAYGRKESGMGHLVLSAPNSARLSGVVVGANEAKVRVNSLTSKTEPSVPLTPQRLELIKAYGRLYSSKIDVAKRVPRFRAARWSILTVAAVFLFAILPSVALGTIVWLGMTAAPSTGPVKANAPASPMLARSASISPVISTPPRLEAVVGDTVPFPIALDGTDRVPARSMVAIRGLPVGSRFSSGRPYGQTEWTLRPDEIGELHLILPETPTSDGLTIELIAPDGRVLTKSGTLLRVNANSDTAIMVHTVTTQRIDGHAAKAP
jgi:hypothetical protein